jgi:hypothetical protein
LGLGGLLLIGGVRRSIIVFGPHRPQKTLPPGANPIIAANSGRNSRR